MSSRPTTLRERLVAEVGHLLEFEPVPRRWWQWRRPLELRLTAASSAALRAYVGAQSPYRDEREPDLIRSR